MFCLINVSAFFNHNYQTIFGNYIFIIYNHISNKKLVLKTKHNIVYNSIFLKQNNFFLKNTIQNL